MNLNIVTASSNCVGNAILSKIANPEDITIGLSRKGVDLENVLDVRISDLSVKETTQRSLIQVLDCIDSQSIDTVKIFHNCFYYVYEITDLSKAHSSNPKLVKHDYDGDGIDDRAYNSLLTTFHNVFDLINDRYNDKKISIGTICSLTDKKSYIPTIFNSMVRSNRLFRDELKNLAITHQNIQSVCISASTVRTHTEEIFRKFSKEMIYWLTGDAVASVLVSEMGSHVNEYKDVDLYVPNPNYELIYRNESDEQLTARIKREIGL